MAAIILCHQPRGAPEGGLTVDLRRWLDALPARLQPLLRRARAEADLDDELSFHLEMETRAGERRGLSRMEAERRARLALQGVRQTKERAREVWPLAWATDLVQDFRYTVQQVNRSPGFAALAVLCLGLGIGANTSVFSALNSVLFRPLPVAVPGGLLMLNRGTSPYFSYPDFQDLQARGRLLSGLTASFPMESDLDVDGVSEFVAAEVVSANYGAVLGVLPVLGRWLTSETEPVAVISHAVWQNRFGGSANVLGQRIGSEAQSYTIVGIAPRAFTGIFAPYRTDIWVPMRTRPRLTAMLDNRSSRLVMVFGRLRSDATPGQASAELNGIDAQLVAEHGASTEPLPPIVAEPIRGIPNPGGRRLVSMSASLLMIVVGLVLLIACVNVGNLLLVRGTLRQRELAVRQALGATKGRLMRQLLTESLVLGIGGGATGLLLALWTTSILERVMPSMRSTFPIDLNLSLDGRVIAFATTLSLATALFCGLVPAWRGSQTSGVAGFKGEVGGSIRRRRPFGLVAQVSVSFVLLLIAGSVIASLRRLQVTDPGFTISGRLYAYIYFPSASTSETRRELYAQALDRLRALPGVLNASQTSVLPLMPSETDCASLSGGSQLHVSTNEIDQGYFQTMGIGMIAGRDFTAIDLPRESSTIIITESLARRLWPHTSPIGERVLIGCEAPQASIVIGVVRDSVVRNVGESPQPRFYRPFTRQYSGGITAVLLQTGTDSASMVPAVRETLVGMGRNVRVYAVEPFSTYIDRSFTSVRWMATVLSGFGLLALVLAAIGLYGVIAYRVSLRTPEIGVRMALGAGRGAIFRDVVLHGLAIAVAGVVIGEVLAIPATRALASLQAGIRPGTPSTHVAAAVLWVVVALVACYVPASRASRVDPMEALRHE
jgi:macrolide transport system ATP-binding/permease protein